MTPEKSEFIDRLTDEARIGEARMLRDEDPFTLDISNQIITSFNDHLKRVNRSQDWAARSMGKSPGTLNQVISGNYACDIEKHIRDIDKWLETQFLKEHAPRPAGFVKTGVAIQIDAMAKYAVRTNTIVLVHGPAGIGKTMTAHAVRAETPGSIYISIKTAGQTGLAVLESIAAALRIGPQSSRARLFGAIEGVLRDTGRLLIVDEVHKLEGRRHDEALHCLRDLHDSTNIPMLWLGMTNIATYIQAGHSKGYEPLDQIYSRIGFWLDLTEQASRTDGGPGVASIDDIQKIITKRQLRVTPDGARYLQALANEFGAGAYRTISKLLLLAEFAAKGNAIDAAMLRKIQASRLGIRAAENLESRIETRLAQTA